MTLSRRCAAVALAASFVANATLWAEEKAEPKFDVWPLFGTWKYESGMLNGVRRTAEDLAGQTAVLTRDGLTLLGEAKFVIDCDIDVDSDPAGVQFTITESPFGSGATARGLLDVENDKLRICYSLDGQAPEAFEAESGSNRHAFVLRRVLERIEIKKLLGEWIYRFGEKEGESLQQEHFAGQSVKIDEETFTLRGEATFVLGYRMNLEEKPAHIDFTMLESPFGAGAQAAGIIQFRGGRLYVCYAPTSGPRPKSFRAAKGSGDFLFVLKRPEEGGGRRDAEQDRPNSR